MVHEAGAMQAVIRSAVRHGMRGVAHGAWVRVAWVRVSCAGCGWATVGGGWFCAAEGFFAGRVEE